MAATAEQNFLRENFYLGLGIFHGLLGLLAWMVAPALARRIYPQPEKDDIRIDLDARTLVATGSFLIGMFFLMTALPALLVDAARAVLWLSNSPDVAAAEQRPMRNPALTGSMLENSVLVLPGAVIAFRPCDLARIFSWLRGAGQYKGDDGPAASKDLRMKTLAAIAIVVVAALHVGFLVLEMFFWEREIGLSIFSMTAQEAAISKTLAANQGLYNGFLAAGLLWGLVTARRGAVVFFLLCVLVAGIFGAATAKPTILFIQALPAAIALVLVFLTRPRAAIG